MEYKKAEVRAMARDITRHSQKDMPNAVDDFIDFIETLYDFQELSDMHEKFPKLIEKFEKIEKKLKNMEGVMSSFITGET